MAVAIVMLWLTAIAEVAAPVLVSYFIDNMVAKNQIVLSVTLLLVAGLSPYRLPHRCCTIFS